MWRKIHLWLGLVSAPIVFIVCITGVMLVYADEIMDWSAGDAKYVQTVEQQRIPVEQMIANVKKHIPNMREPAYMVDYRDSSRTVRFNCYVPGKGLRMIYMNPYTGKILKEDSSINFFFVVSHIHETLMLHHTGKWIVDIAVIIFLIELITGLILWWPKKWLKKVLKFLFTVKWNSSFKRVNNDVHRVFGFYGLSICLLLCMTGLIIAFQPLENLTRVMAGGTAVIQRHGMGGPHGKMGASEDEKKPTVPIQDALDLAWNAYPKKTEIQLATFRMPFSQNFQMNVAQRIGLKSARNSSVFLVNRYSGKIVKQPKTTQINAAVDSMLWNLHMGTWMGWLSKLLTFLGGLIGAILPISGFYIWYNKWKSSRKNRLKLEV